MIYFVQVQDKLFDSIVASLLCVSVGCAWWWCCCCLLRLWSSSVSWEEMNKKSFLLVIRLLLLLMIYWSLWNSCESFKFCWLNSFSGLFTLFERSPSHHTEIVMLPQHARCCVQFPCDNQLECVYSCDYDASRRGKVSHSFQLRHLTHSYAKARSSVSAVAMELSFSYAESSRERESQGRWGIFHVQLMINECFSLLLHAPFLVHTLRGINEIELNFLFIYNE